MYPNPPAEMDLFFIPTFTHLILLALLAVLSAISHGIAAQKHAAREHELDE